MVQVACRTNLDFFGEQWPDWLPAVPRVGERVASKSRWGDFRLELEVVAVTWAEGEPPTIELHMTSFQRSLPSRSGAEPGSIRAFYEWYAPLVGQSVSSFI